MLIRHCPKCNYKGSYIVVVPEKGAGLFQQEEMYRIHCTHCEFTTRLHKTREAAIEKWNHLLLTRPDYQNSYILFDFETSGLNPPEAKPVQLSYMILDSSFHLQAAKNFYFQVEEEILESAAKVHGLTRQKLLDLKAGTIEESKKEIQDDFLESGRIAVAHNVQFDLKFLKEFFLPRKPISFCTMNHYTDIIKIPGKYNTYKWPRVAETMDYLGVQENDALDDCFEYYGSKKIGYHDARFDIVCIYKMIQYDFYLREALQYSRIDSEGFLQ